MAHDKPSSCPVLPDESPHITLAGSSSNDLSAASSKWKQGSKASHFCDGEGTSGSTFEATVNFADEHFVGVLGVENVKDLGDKSSDTFCFVEESQGKIGCNVTVHIFLSADDGSPSRGKRLRILALNAQKNSMTDEGAQIFVHSAIELASKLNFECPKLRPFLLNPEPPCFQDLLINEHKLLGEAEAQTQRAKPAAVEQMQKMRLRFIDTQVSPWYPLLPAHSKLALGSSIAGIKGRASVDVAQTAGMQPTSECDILPMLLPGYEFWMLDLEPERILTGYAALSAQLFPMDTVFGDLAGNAFSGGRS